jgi:phage replication O-like protein O
MTGEDIQIENGDFTRIHNEILEALAKTHLSGGEFRAVLFLLRKTYGWHKKEDTVSLSQWARGIDVGNNQKAIEIINKLIAKKIIYRGPKVGLVWVYGFNKYFEEWEHDPISEGSTPQGTTPQGTKGSTPQGMGVVPPAVREVVPHRVLTKDKKDILTKDKLKKVVVVEIPPNLNTPEFLKAWGEWLVHRTQIKHKVTELTQQKQLKMLAQYSPKIAIAMIEQSITNGWQGIFVLSSPTSKSSLRGPLSDAQKEDTQQNYLYRS